MRKFLNSKLKKASTNINNSNLLPILGWVFWDDLVEKRISPGCSMNFVIMVPSVLLLQPALGQIGMACIETLPSEDASSKGCQRLPQLVDGKVGGYTNNRKVVLKILHANICQ